MMSTDCFVTVAATVARLVLNMQSLVFGLLLCLIACVTCSVIQTGANTITATTFAVQVNYACTVLWATLDSSAPAAWNTYGPATITLITNQFTALLLVAVSFPAIGALNNTSTAPAMTCGLAMSVR